jgi:hypothetical protein
VNLHSKPSAYKFYEDLCEAGCFCDGNVPFAVKSMDGTGIPLDVLPLNELISFDNCKESCLQGYNAV